MKKCERGTFVAFKPSANSILLVLFILFLLPLAVLGLKELEVGVPLVADHLQLWLSEEMDG